MVVTIRRSKTDQEGAGTVKGIPYGHQEASCPVRAVREWCDAAGITESWLFRPLDRYGRLGEGALPGEQVAREVRRAVAQIGLDPAAYGGHSLRAGLVTEAARAGVPEHVIMQQTGHTDVRTLRRYIRDGSLFRESAAGQVGL